MKKRDGAEWQHYFRRNAVPKLFVNAIYPREELGNILKGMYHQRIKSDHCAMFHRKLNSSSIYYIANHPRIALFRKALYRKMAGRVWKRINDRDRIFAQACFDERRWIVRDQPISPCVYRVFPRGH